MGRNVRLIAQSCIRIRKIPRTTKIRKKNVATTLKDRLNISSKSDLNCLSTIKGSYRNFMRARNQKFVHVSQ